MMQALLAEQLTATDTRKLDRSFSYGDTSHFDDKEQQLVTTYQRSFAELADKSKTLDIYKAELGTLLKQSARTNLSKATRYKESSWSDNVAVAYPRSFIDYVKILEEANWLAEYSKTLADLLIANLPYSRELQERINYLYQVSREDEPDDVSISLRSLTSFVKFIQTYRPRNYPRIALSPDGNIIARWQNQRNEFLNVHFLPTQEISFVLFIPDKDNPRKTNHLSGKTNINDIIGLLRCYDISWAI